MNSSEDSVYGSNGSSGARNAENQRPRSYLEFDGRKAGHLLLGEFAQNPTALRATGVAHLNELPGISVLRPEDLPVQREENSPKKKTGRVKATALKTGRWCKKIWAERNDPPKKKVKRTPLDE